MGDLRDHPGAALVDFVREMAVGRNTLFISETQRVAQIRHIGIYRERVGDDTAHAASRPCQPVFLHGLIDRSVWALVSQGHGCHENAVFYGHGTDL